MSAPLRRERYSNPVAAEGAQPLVVAVDVVGLQAIAGPLTASAVVVRASQPEPVFRVEGIRERLLSKAADVPVALHRTLAAYLKRAAAGWATIHVPADAPGAALAAQTLAVARALERMHHTDPESLEGDIQVYLRRTNALPSEMLPAKLTQRPGTSDWHTGAAWLLAWHAHVTEMIRLAQRYPDYGFDTHYGWPTPAHRRALRLLGPTPIHRSQP